MTKTNIIFELAELEAPLRLTRVAIEKSYYSAAIAYLEDIEAEAIRLRHAVQLLYANSPKPVAANFLNPNDPAYVPYNHE